MRSVLRTLAGLVLVTCGVLALAGGVAAWAVGLQRTEGAFVASIAPVRTDGYAIVVPDVMGVLDQHGVARHLGDGRLTITVRSAGPTSDDRLSVAFVSSGDAQRYLAGAARTELLSVGYTTGEQPVSVVGLHGGAPVGAAPWRSVDLDPGRVAQATRVATVWLDVPTEGTTALVVQRWDGGAGLGVSMTVGFAPSSWGTATAVLLISGLIATVTGMALVIMRRPWIDPFHPMVLGFEETYPEPEPALVASGRRMWHTGPEPNGYWPTNAPAAGDTVESPYVHTAT